MGDAPAAVATVDFNGESIDVNGDSIVDIITVNRDSHDISVLLGQGDGNFTVLPGASIHDDDLDPQAIAVGNLTGDAILDVVTANSGTGTISILIGQGNGQFTQGERIEAELEPTSVAIANVNQDAFADIIIANRASNELSILFGNGDGTFEGERRFRAGVSPSSVIVGNVNPNPNMDAFSDLIVTNSGSNDVSILLGHENGNGTFVAEQRFEVGLSTPASAALGSLKGDPSSYLVVSDEADDMISVLRIRGDGTFFLADQMPSFPNGKQIFEVVNGPRSTATADLNGDGNDDIVTANFFSSDVSVLLDDMNGSYTPAVGQPFTLGTNQRPNAVALADLNNDDHIDFVTVNTLPSRISIHFGDGSGSFPNHTSADILSIEVGNEPVALAIDDLNGDTHLDIVTANQKDNSISILIGDGLGSFPNDLRFQARVGIEPLSLVIADFNGDKKPDIATANSVSNDISVLLANELGNFSSEIRFNVGNSPSSIAAADLNGDGHPDLATANRFSSNVSILIGNGSGQFIGAQHLSVGNGPTSILLKDLNHDGLPDLITTNRDSANISVLFGRRDGAF